MNVFKRNLACLSLALAQALALSACGGLLTADRAPETTWWLAPLAGNTHSEAPAGSLDLELDVVPGLDTDRILTIDGAARLNHFAGARWPDNLPDVLHSVLRRNLEPTVPNGADCRLHLEVREYFAGLDDDGDVDAVRLDLTAEKDCGGGGRAFRIKRSSPALGPGMQGIVAAFQQVLDDATRELSDELSD
ncbi:MAG: hypothetical protein GWM87_02350 [Xanthomonadales bacterium]|nr:hypothetical protein [Xanthomonadales bacterium]NIX11906.1 hypothetical protein [Xanthomonadales bacterium]